MAIQSEISQVSYLGNGSTVTGYPVPFYFFEDTDLKVSRTDATGVVTQLSLGAQYSVSGAGNASGGSVTTTTAYGGSDRITIARIVPATQPLVYDENDRFPAKSHERGLDRLTMLAQQVGRAAKRCFRLGDSQGEIPPIEARTPHTLAGLDGDGAPKLYTIDQLLTMLSLPAPILNRPMKTFADDGGRMAAVPDFVGQIGTQQYTRTIYIANGLTAGSWMVHALMPSQMHAPLILDQEYSESVGADGNFLFCPDALSPIKRGTFAKLKDWIWTQPPTGTVVQTSLATLSTYLDTNSFIPLDDSIPQIGEGAQVLTCAITPKSAANKLRLTFTGKTFAIIQSCVAIFRQGSSGAIDFAVSTAASHGQITLRAEVSAGTTEAITFEVRAGRAGAVVGHVYFNGDSATRIGGGAMKTTLLVEEVRA